MVGGLAGENKQGKAIYKKLMDAKNCKIIALTGTPIVNSIYEAAILCNILHGYIFTTIFKIEYVSPKYGENWNLLQFEKEMKNLEEITHIEINKNNKTIELLLTIKPYELQYQELLKTIIDKASKEEVTIEYLTNKEYTLFPDDGDGVGEEEFMKYFVDKTGENADKLKNKELLKRRILGLISYYKSKEQNFPSIKTDQLIEVEMSNYQYSTYNKARQEEKISHKLAEIRVFSRQFSNFAFPSEIPRPGIGQKIAKRNRKEDNENVAKLIRATETQNAENLVKKDELKKYQKAVAEALNKLTENADKYLVKDKLGTYSNKMLKMLERVQESKGLVFVYSDFRSLEGVEIFSRILEANGFAYYSATNKANKNKPKYALYTGTEDFTERSKILSIFNNPENKYGKDIKVILATSAGAEGLDLKNIRDVLIMEPYWNNVRMQQVIGRAVRRNSHIDLPPDERNVSIYRYISVLSADDKAGLKPKDQLSTDQVILDIAKRKEAITQEMLHVMKETAVDCVLNAYDNDENITCFNFGTGKNTEGIAFLPRLGRNMSRGVESEMREVETVLRHGAIDSNNFVYFIENKKLYKITNKLKRTPVDSKGLKFKKKVAIDLNKNELYDHDSAMKSKVKVLIGKYGNDGTFKGFA